ncbi:hypothetical protein MMAN_11410 [Mycobacterium mantenii]|uniref:Uncharacterized protein n=1 Tax=Mycobacterium mantenii TaxID=560555 RepID=A0ABM7JQ22_MYCNT|nr:hypothetical protein MMAN_11410 [Mycobacterium mantenii]
MKNVNPLVTTAAPVSDVAGLWRAFAPDAGARRSAPADRPNSGPESRCELRESPREGTCRPDAPRCDAGAARRTCVEAGDKIRPRIKVREYMPDSAAYPADGGRVSTL